MLFLAIGAAVAASAGWAVGIVIAEAPARRLGAVAFTRIQLIACAALLAALCAWFGQWSSVIWGYWPAYAASAIIGVVVGNLAMIECLRRGGPRRTELLMTLRAPLAAVMAALWLGDVPSAAAMAGGALVLAGVCLAIQFGGEDRTPGRHGADGQVLVIGFGVLAAAAQGFGFLALKPALLAGTEPMAAAAIRLIGAAAVLGLIAPAFTMLGLTMLGFTMLGLAQRRPRIVARVALTPALLGRTVLPGVIGYGVSSSLLLFALAWMETGIAMVLGALSPVIVLFVLWAARGAAPSTGAVCGAGLAVLGVAVMVLA